MHVRFTEDCISTSLHFGATDEYRIIQEDEFRAIRTYGTASGMGQGEFKDCVMKNPMNQLHLQPTTYDLFDAYDLAFRPTSSTFAILSELYMANARLPPSQRRRFDNVPGFQGAPHILEIRNNFQEDIFLKHPITGEVTIHQHPYSNLPLFYPRTAHPVATSHNAFNFLLHTFSAMRFKDNLCIAIRECEKACNAMERSLAQVSAGVEKPLPQEAQPSSRKRTASCDQDAPCTKRAKRSVGCQEMLDTARADAIAKTPLVARTTAALPSRKRKAPCEQDGPCIKRTRRNPVST
ncbi:hypothetical protein CYLTODRAFT_493030 [Cylindrobasidium torrendii FP15055 ss-10]|uniref:Uncharacterized protein n=1 Tax=Cylindrobasidium torrendii FP15055 ss-10 TaxID=1314674 RepID=A0A0D7B1R6_9AGAR|nr:hypothetical protein CYLTODRAFT_493030 [Cylindrobasidium torrendii FP15055 ss-10]